jgi:MFS family permease
MSTRFSVAPVTPARAGVLSFWFAVDETAKRALIAASFGWMLDAFDIMLFSMVLASLIADLSLSKVEAGLLGSAALLASAGGGLVFGFIADRWGRTKALILSVLVYSVFTGMCGLAQSVGQLAVYRVLLGFGMGGEWASGAALISETWPAEHRGKAFGVMQSMWAVGYGAAALVTALVLPRWGYCRRSSRCGCGATSKSHRCGSMRKREPGRAAGPPQQRHMAPSPECSKDASDDSPPP